VTVVVRALARLDAVITSGTGLCGPLLGQGLRQRMQGEMRVRQDMVGQG
jgi:hypothetical protein